jgi:F-type H+-transporting ATPase subunit delta
MASEHASLIAGYADALVAIAQAEGVLDRVEDELFRFARTIEASPDLRSPLVDPATDTATKMGIVTDLLAQQANPQTIAAVALLIQTGRIRHLTEIADAVVERAASARQQTVAEVRSAVPLDAGQQQRLAQALARIAGREVALKVVVDPNVVGGLVTKLGDTVIDGSVSRRLVELRSRLTA